MDLIQQGGSWDNPLSKQMIELKYAVKVEETYVSKMDNETRQTVERQIECHQREQQEQQATASAVVTDDDDDDEEPFSRIVNSRKREYVKY